MGVPHNPRRATAWRLAVVLALGLTLPAMPLAAKVYRWTDAEGNVQFSDRPPIERPRTGESEPLTPAPAPPRLEVALLAVGFTLPDATTRDIEALAGTVHRIYRDRMHAPLPERMQSNIRVLANRTAFDRYLGRDTREAGIEARFMPGIDEIVTWDQPDPGRLLPALAQECNRALTQRAFPRAPAWLRHGLDGYLSALSKIGDAFAISPDPRWQPSHYPRVRVDLFPPLTDMLGYDEREWQRRGLRDPDLENRAWSLIYFLMSVPHGTALLGSLLGAAESADIGAFSSAAFIDDNFEGGVAGLERAWHDWMDVYKPAHYY